MTVAQFVLLACWLFAAITANVESAFSKSPVRSRDILLPPASGTSIQDLQTHIVRHKLIALHITEAYNSTAAAPCTVIILPDDYVRLAVIFPELERPDKRGTESDFAFCEEKLREHLRNSSVGEHEISSHQINIAMPYLQSMQAELVGAMPTVRAASARSLAAQILMRQTQPDPLQLAYVTLPPKLFQYVLSDSASLLAWWRDGLSKGGFLSTTEAVVTEATPPIPAPVTNIKQVFLPESELGRAALVVELVGDERPLVSQLCSIKSRGKVRECDGAKFIIGHSWIALQSRELPASIQAEVDDLMQIGTALAIAAKDSSGLVTLKSMTIVRY